jgi:hypothetical protein
LWSTSILQGINVPKEVQRNSPDVLAAGVEYNGEILLTNFAGLIGQPDLGDLDLLDVGCGVGFTQTLINGSLASRSYTRIELSLSIVQWLKENGESRDERFGRMENRLVRRTEAVYHEFVLM